MNSLNMVIALGAWGLLIGLAIVYWLREVGKRVRKDQQNAKKLERYLSELQALHDIVKAITIHFNLEELLDKVLKFAIRVINQAQAGAVLLVDEKERNKLVVRGIYGFRKDVRGLEHQFGEGYTGWVAQEGKPLLVTDVPADYKNGRFVSRFSSLKTEMGVKSSVAAPIKFGDSILGVIILHSVEKTNAFGQEDLRLLSVVADQLAIAIENNRLYQETESALLEHQALYHIGLLLTSTEDVNRVLDLIVESGMRITGTPAGSLALFDREKREFYLAASIGFSPSFANLSRWKLRPGGLTSRILEKGSAFMITDITKEPAWVNQTILDEGIKSLLAVPLKLENRIVGILYVDDFTPREFTEREISALNLLANQATIALLKAQAFKQTLELAITDGLTKVFNHRYFKQRLEQEIRRAKRYHRPLSLIILDVDYFKNYNDIFGHLKGDKVLEGVAALLKEVTRETDIIARYGGEEFAILLPETGKKEGLRVARKIRAAVEMEDFFGEEALPSGKFTISCGVATFPDDAVTRYGLIEQADRALYRAKQTGRNKVCAAR